MVRLVYALRRGPRGLGLDIDSTNRIVDVSAGGQAAADGLVQVGDQIVAVDGMDLLERRMVDVVRPGQNAYEVVVERASASLEARKARAFPSVSLLRLLEVTVRRGPKGMGIDIGNVSSVRGLTPGGLAEQDGLVQPGDMIIAVDRAPVAAQGLKPMIVATQAAYRFMLLRPESSSALLMQHVEQSRSAAMAQLASINEAATRRAVATAAEAERAHVVSDSSACAADLLGSMPTGSNPFDPPAGAPVPSQAGHEASHATTGQMDVPSSAAERRPLASFTLVHEQAAAAAVEAQEAARRLHPAPPKHGQVSSTAPLSTTAESLAARPRSLAPAELSLLQQETPAPPEHKHSAADALPDARSKPSGPRSSSAQAVAKTTPSTALAGWDPIGAAAALFLGTAEIKQTQKSRGTEPSDAAAEQQRSSQDPQQPLAGRTAHDGARPLIAGVALKSISQAHLRGEEDGESESDCSDGEGKDKDEDAKGKPADAQASHASAPSGPTSQKELQPVASLQESKELRVFWDIETCPLPSDQESTAASAAAGMHHRLKSISTGGRLLDVSVYGSFTDHGSGAREQALLNAGMVPVHCAAPPARSSPASAMLTDMMLHAFDQGPGAAILLVTTHREVFHAATQLAARAFQVSVAIPAGFDRSWLPSADRLSALHGVYCWPELWPYSGSPEVASTGSSNTGVETVEQILARASKLLAASREAEPATPTVALVVEPMATKAGEAGEAFEDGNTADTVEALNAFGGVEAVEAVEAVDSVVPSKAVLVASSEPPSGSKIIVEAGAEAEAEAEAEVEAERQAAMLTMDVDELVPSAAPSVAAEAPVLPCEATDELAKERAKERVKERVKERAKERASADNEARAGVAHDDGPLAAMIQDARAIGDAALVAKLEAIIG